MKKFFARLFRAVTVRKPSRLDRRLARLAVEGLEARQLLSVTNGAFAGISYTFDYNEQTRVGTLTINATEGADRLTLQEAFTNANPGEPGYGEPRPVGINIIPQGSEQQGGVSFAPGSRITVRLFARGGNDRIVNATRFASLIDGGGGNDYLEGGTGNDTLSGGDNEDWVFGGWGDDALNGDAGDDHLYGGDGTDTLQGGAGSDHYRTTGYNDPWWYTTEWTYNHYDQSGGTVYTDGRTVTG